MGLRRIIGTAPRRQARPLGVAEILGAIDVFAWRLTQVSYVEDLTDLGQGQPGGLSTVDEVHTGQGLGV